MHELPLVKMKADFAALFPGCQNALERASCANDLAAGDFVVTTVVKRGRVQNLLVELFSNPLLYRFVES